MGLEFIYLKIIKCGSVFFFKEKDKGDKNFSYISVLNKHNV